MRIYLTNRLRSRNFYKVIVNEGEAGVNDRFMEIILVKTTCVHYFFHIISKISCFLRKTRPYRVIRRLA